MSIMSSIAIGLDLDEQFFHDMIHEEWNNFRLLNYPPIKTSLLREEGQARTSAHSGIKSLLDSACDVYLMA